VRQCIFSTGPFAEPIEVWDEPRLLKFGVTANPAPLNELSPYGNIQPAHLHGYFVSKQGQFLLTLYQEAELDSKVPPGISIRCGLRRTGIYGRITLFTRFICECWSIFALPLKKASGDIELTRSAAWP